MRRRARPRRGEERAARLHLRLENAARTDEILQAAPRGGRGDEAGGVRGAERPLRHTHVRVARGSRGRSGPARHDDELRGADDIERFSAHGRADGKMRRLRRRARARNLRSRGGSGEPRTGVTGEDRAEDERRRAGVAAGEERRRCRPRGAFRRASGGSREERLGLETRARGGALPRQDRGADLRGDDRPMRRVRLAVQREIPLRPAMPEGEAPRGLSRRDHRETRADERL
mmetsp:Transcript_2005/g.8025  ORF Transcript_2005/g.8025 Transcript_2005/m.8025 type:complete len:231 (+) Transcript_2005:507-1199(+)